jgi:[1-hydroxy-2-(trimethylamino)ethyl]phosphonate dioxygenase
MALPPEGRPWRKMMNTVDLVFELYETQGAAWYGDEQISQLEHALQAAQLARADGAPPHLVAAALLHDIGHLLGPPTPDGVRPPRRDEHEHTGPRFLASLFRLDVVQLVGLHVLAKRYLCTVEPRYMKGLSLASLRGLLQQGGPLGEAEARAFERHSRYREAVALRRWDDNAKMPGLETPGLETYREVLEEVLVSRSPGMEAAARRTL